MIEIEIETREDDREAETEIILEAILDLIQKIKEIKENIVQAQVKERKRKIETNHQKENRNLLMSYF